ncbi:MAG: major facilitator superfamily domain-containing protein 6 [bacterium]|nr:major facilitator superfamily domain-containing protein 6 [bacterium]
MKTTAPKAFYFFFFAALGALSPYLVLYYQDLGFTGRQIGLLAGIPPLIALVSSPFWGAVADARQRHKQVLVLAMAGTLIAAGLLSQTTQLFWLLPVVSLYAFCLAPVIPLVDNAVLDLLGDRRDEYGRLRLWGTIGWGVSAVGVGVLAERGGLGWPFGCFLVLMSGGLLAGACLPAGPVKARRPFWVGFRELMGKRAWVVLMGTVFIVGVCSAIVRNFLFLHLESLGAGRDLMGLSLTFAVVGELPVFFFSDRMLRRWGPRGLLIFSILAFSLQAFLFSLMWVPWLVLPFQMLHGPSFSALLTARIAYAKEIAPEGLGATAQGLLSGVSAGLASSAGALIGGVLYDGVGAVVAFRWASAGALLGLGLLLAAGRTMDTRKELQSTGSSSGTGSESNS